MKNVSKKLGFTLIELLVVITIIGILATGAVSVYTSQIQKARDSNRITDLKALQGSLEQAYSDMSKYPYPNAGDASCNPTTDTTNTSYGMNCLVSLGYMTELPSDSKTNSKGAGSALDYTYVQAASASTVDAQIYEVSTGFEADASIASKAADRVDKGGDGARFETGNDLTLDSTTGDAAMTGASCTKPISGGTAILIKGPCS